MAHFCLGNGPLRLAICLAVFVFAKEPLEGHEHHSGGVWEDCLYAPHFVEPGIFNF